MRVASPGLTIKQTEIPPQSPQSSNFTLDSRHLTALDLSLLSHPIQIASETLDDSSQDLPPDRQDADLALITNSSIPMAWRVASGRCLVDWDAKVENASWVTCV